MLNVMDQQQDGVSYENKYSNETTTSASTVEVLKQIQSIISHPSSRVGQMTQQILWQVARDAITAKVRELRNNTSETLQENK